MLGDYLIEFAAVVRAGSLTTAADKLALSPSSLSRHMRDLEAQLGMALLRRLPNGVEPTEEGRYVYTRAADLADIVSDIDSYAARHKASRATLGVYGVAELPTYLRAFAQASANPANGQAKPRFPRHADLGNRNVGELLDRSDIDIALLRPTELELELNDGRFALEPFCTEGVVVMVDPSNPLSQRSSIDIRELAGSLLLHADSHFDQAHRAWLEFKALLRAHNVSYRAEACDLSSTTDWFMAPSQGVIPLSAAHNAVSLLRDTGRARVEIEGVHYTYYALWRKDDAYARAVVQRARTALEALREGRAR